MNYYYYIRNERGARSRARAHERTTTRLLFRRDPAAAIRTQKGIDVFVKTRNLKEQEKTQLNANKTNK